MPKPENKIVIEDLVDFYKRWPELRQEALAIQNAPRLAADKKALLEWMIMVIDRVGPADLEPVLEKNDV